MRGLIHFPQRVEPQLVGRRGGRAGLAFLGVHLLDANLCVLVERHPGFTAALVPCPVRVGRQLKGKIGEGQHACTERGGAGAFHKVALPLWERTSDNGECAFLLGSALGHGRRDDE